MGYPVRTDQDDGSVENALNRASGDVGDTCEAGIANEIRPQQDVAAAFARPETSCGSEKRQFWDETWDRIEQAKSHGGDASEGRWFNDETHDAMMRMNR